MVGISGASGSVLARATIDRLLALEQPVIATASPAARMVWRDEMEESFGDALERVVSWKGTGDPGDLAGRPVRLRISMRDADLYSLRFR